MSMQLTPGEQDTLIAGGLITSPAWASWLGNVNEILTTLSLLVGLGLGAARIWRACRGRDGDRGRGFDA
jgi:hypothetical protein